MEVALFVPCYVDQLAPEVAVAALRVLERAGCRVRYAPPQGCCGQPLLNLGASREARRLARATTARLAGCEAVVSPSASCVATMRVHYRELGIGPDAVPRVFELTEFLVRVLGRPDVGARFPHRVALLQSCHGLRELGLGAGDAGPGPTEAALRAVRGLELAWPDPPDECCGFGGAFSVRHPELSARMGLDRLEALSATGAEYVTASDASCLLHLDGLRRRRGVGPRALHVAEILCRE